MPNDNLFEINGRTIGREHPPFVIAEISANHGGELSKALDLIDIAAAAGASAVKLQHYRPELITTKSDLPEFRIEGGTLWDGRQLFDLYEEAMMPWEWTPALFDRAAQHGLICFSSPFDFSAVDFLEEQKVSAYKVASFELVDLPLIEYISKTGKPMIMSTGMASIEEIDQAVQVARSTGNNQIALLRCNSGYPASPDEMDLLAIPFMRDRWNCEIGLSDHTLNFTASVVAIALGASIVEKHIIAEREDGGPDAAFSCEPDELKALVEEVNNAHKSLGFIRFGPSKREMSSTAFRRSLRISNDMKKGEVLTSDTVRSMRPAGGLAPIELNSVLGKRIKRDAVTGTPLTWDLIAPDEE